MSKQSLPVPSMTALAPAAARQALAKLAPRLLLKNPVIFATAVVAGMVTVLGLRDLATASMTRHRESLYLMRIKERHERVLLHYRQLAGDLDSLAPAASSPPRQP